MGRNGNQREPRKRSDMKIVIDVDEGKLHGNTGCNIMNGNFTTDMGNGHSISFQKIITTRMAAPDDSHETEFRGGPSKTQAYARPISPTKVLLLDNSGKVVLEPSALRQVTEHLESISKIPE